MLTKMKEVTVRNNNVFLLHVGLLCICVPIFVGCTQFGGQKRVAPISTEEAVSLVIEGKPGRAESVDYFHQSRVQTFVLGQKVKEKDEIVEFTAENKVVEYDNVNKLSHVTVEVVKKDGLVDLHDLAFPEKGEIIKFVFTPQGEVAFAGGYPRESVFYVPPLSLPDAPVKVGDTWEMSRNWVTMKSGVPLRLDLVTILKNIFPCGDNGRCADLEISGAVSFGGDLKGTLEFESEIVGRLLFSVDHGSVLWSQVQSQEVLSQPDGKTLVKSCLTSHLKTPAKDRWPIKKSLACDPNSMAIPTVPGT